VVLHFDGDAMSNWSIVRNFELYVHVQVDSDRQKLSY